MGKREYDKVITLVPYGLPQFLDFEVEPDKVKKIVRNFVEEEQPSEDGARISKLRELVTAKDGYSLEYADIPGERYTGKNHYSINSDRNLNPFMGKWLPIPFLREESGVFHEDHLPQYRKGPANWARAYVTRVPDEKDPEQLNWRIVLAFDMQVEPLRGDRHLALSPDDVSAMATLSLADQIRDNSWFLAESWVSDWLESVWKDYFKDEKKASRERPQPEDKSETQLDHLGAYFVYLQVLQAALRDEKNGNRQVKIINLAGTQDTASDPNASDTVDVDLILDIGNSRTTGILVENRPGSKPDIRSSYRLNLRDLSRPENSYNEPFETRVEFSKTEFGDMAYSRRSGRKKNAFAWPSPVRIGIEATRLANTGVYSGGVSGITSPKRYLWSEDKSHSLWYFNRRNAVDKEELISTNPICKYLNNLGMPLRCVKEPESPDHTDPRQLRDLFSVTLKNVINEKDIEALPANQPRFSNSSMMMFLFMEIIQQALVTINSPAQRYLSTMPNYPRRLRSIIFTVPPGMPFAEQRIYRRWAYAAVDVLWEALGWKDGFYTPPLLAGHAEPGGEQSRDYRLNPEIRSRMDEATCTQLVYLYNEITGNYTGDARLFFEIMGKEREVPNEFNPKQIERKPTLRVATIDIGGGTTDLSISTFVLANDKGSTNRIVPIQEIRDGINYGGDDVLRKIIQTLVFKAIAERIEGMGVGRDRAEKALNALFAVKDDDEKVQKLRVQFLRLVAIPAAYEILSQYEAIPMNDLTSDINISLAKILQPLEQDNHPGHALLKKTIDYFNSQIQELCGVNPQIQEMDINIPVKAIDDTISKAISAKLKNLGELIYAYDCDALLLSGRPSCWNAVEREIRAVAPVAPDRVIPMRNYQVGDWYPFTDVEGRITDPKTTVVTGAILSTLAQNSIDNFAFDSSKLKLKSTARYVGQIAEDKLSREMVWFPNDRPDKKNGEEKSVKVIEFSSPITIGFRQLDLPRWGVTRCWRMEFSSEEAQRQAEGHTPYAVRVEFKSSVDDDDNDNPTLDNDLLAKVDEPVIASGQDAVQGHWFGGDAELKPVPSATPVRIVLRTLPTDQEEGCWMDTGILFEERII